MNCFASSQQYIGCCHVCRVGCRNWVRKCIFLQQLLSEREKLLPGPFCHRFVNATSFPSYQALKIIVKRIAVISSNFNKDVLGRSFHSAEGFFHVAAWFRVVCLQTSEALIQYLSVHI